MNPSCGDVLIISGDMTSACAIERLLSDGDYHTRVAPSADEMIEACRDTWFHLALIDTDTLQDSVDDLIGKLRLVEPDILVVALGDHEGITCSGICYLDKPLSIEHIKGIFVQAVTVREDRNHVKLLRGTILAICISSLLCAFLIWLW